MKKYILSALFLIALYACNNNNSPEIQPIAGNKDKTAFSTDSLQPSEMVKILGIGLTQEELIDDTVFFDGSKPTSWEVAGISDVKLFKLFLKQVQYLILNNDKVQLAKLISYPLGNSIKTENDFIQHYERIFSKAAKLSIARINFSQLFRNSKGVMTEEGRVWFSQLGNQFKIIAVNS
ncbi:MAG: hypothetical protein WKI04_02730 [Ferruginibacter sp.]